MRKGLWGAAEYRTNKAGEVLNVGQCRAYFRHPMQSAHLSTTTEEYQPAQVVDKIF